MCSVSFVLASPVRIKFPGAYLEVVGSPAEHITTRLGILPCPCDHIWNTAADDLLV